MTDLVKAEGASPAAATRLAALRYIDELCGVVTVAQEKPGDTPQEFLQIFVDGPPPPRPGSAEALRLLATAKGSPYDETFPSTPESESEPAPPRPFKSAFRVE